MIEPSTPPTAAPTIPRVSPSARSTDPACRREKPSARVTAMSRRRRRTVTARVWTRPIPASRPTPTAAMRGSWEALTDEDHLGPRFRYDDVEAGLAEALRGGTDVGAVLPGDRDALVAVDPVAPRLVTDDIERLPLEVPPVADGIRVDPGKSEDAGHQHVSAARRAVDADGVADPDVEARRVSEPSPISLMPPWAAAHG